MKKFISFTLLTLFTSHIYAIQLKNSEYGFELGGNKYFQESEEGLVLSNDGNIKKLNITPGMMPEIYKLSNEYVVVSVAGPYYPAPVIQTINFNYQAKEIDTNLKNIPQHLINGDFSCESKEQENKIFFNCSNYEYKTNVYKYVYSNQKFTATNSPNSTKVNQKHCLGEFQMYSSLRASKPRGGYRENTMPLSITRGLNSRLKNMNTTKYAEILNSKNKLTQNQFQTKYCV